MAERAGVRLAWTARARPHSARSHPPAAARLSLHISQHPMPPSKRASKAKAKEPAPNEPPVSVLLARCSRGTLEMLLEQAVSAGAVSIDQIAASLPEAQRGTTIALPKISKGVMREGTGLFDLLDEELLLQILSYVDCTKTRLACIVATCTAWRELVDVEKKPTDVAMTLLKTIRMSANRLSTHGGAVQVSASGASRLVAFLPDPALVTTLEVQAGDKHQNIPPDVLKKMLPKFAGLTSFSISGKKVSAAVLAVASKQPFAKNLTTFELGYSGAKIMDALPLLSQATKLSTLKFEIGWSGDETAFLRSLVNQWRERRGGGATPLLTSLECTGWCQGMSWPCFAGLSELFPELTELRTNVHVRLSDGFGSASGDAFEIPFARLRVLRISSLIHPFGGTHMSTASLEAMLRTLFSSAPVLEDLFICHGKIHLSSKDIKLGKRMPPLPGVGGALADLPISLKKLHLGTISLLPGDFDLAPGFGALRSLTLYCCGDYAVEVAKSLLGPRCPLLRPAGISTTVGGSALVCLDPAIEAKKKADAEERASRAAAGTSAGAGPASFGDGDGAAYDESRPGSALQGGDGSHTDEREGEEEEEEEASPEDMQLEL